MMNNYETLAQHRWKYILEFNHNKDHSISSRHQEREIRRILALVGAESLLENDVIPKKYLILECVPKVKGAPEVPQFKVGLGSQLFKKKFKVYY